MAKLKYGAKYRGKAQFCEYGHYGAPNQR